MYGWRVLFLGNVKVGPLSVDSVGATVHHLLREARVEFSVQHVALVGGQSSWVGVEYHFSRTDCWSISPNHYDCNLSALE